MRPVDSILVSGSPSATASIPTPRTDTLATVIVACCGQLEYTRLCVPSLLRFTRQPYELLFLDSDSRDGTVDYLDGLAAAALVPVEVARVPADPPVGSARREDVIPIRGEYVALLNNDVIVTQGWLDGLISLAASVPNAGMTAPMSNHGPQSLRVENVPYGLEEYDPAGEASAKAPSDNGPPRMPRSGLLPLIDKVNRFASEWREKNAGQWFEADTLAGGCVVVKREVLRKMGLFPTRTPLGTFDMAALCQRVQQAGFRLIGCRELFVHSFGSRG